MAGAVTATMTQISPTTSEAAIRQHRVLIDRPVARAGTDHGPMGGELLLAALGGCYMSTLLAAVRAREAPVHDVVAEVVGTLEDAPSRFTAIEMRISAVCEDLELLERLVTVAERGCLVANSLRHALPITISVAQRVQ